ncbi:MAG: hypothetical protein IPL55_03550 [Saprospiraceae bacterium]|nr:hypothetical protein [Saprospiraceae bacterium]
MKYGNNTIEEVIATTDRILEKINYIDGTFNEDAFNEDVNKLTWVWVSERPTTLYDVLSASGDFSLISSLVLRKKLADLKRNQESLIKFEEIQNCFVDDKLRLFLNQNIDRTRVRFELKSAERIVVRHTSVFPPNTNEILQNREFANILTDLIFFTKKIIENYKRIDDDIAQLDSLVLSKYANLVLKKYIPY